MRPAPRKKRDSGSRRKTLTMHSLKKKRESALKRIVLRTRELRLKGSLRNSATLKKKLVRTPNVSVNKLRKTRRKLHRK